jgi:hypothetical protein
MSDINHAGSDLIFELEIASLSSGSRWCHYPSIGNFRSDGNPRVNRGCGLTVSLKQLPILFLWHDRLWYWYLVTVNRYGIVGSGSTLNSVSQFFHLLRS